MYDTERRVALVKKRMIAYRRRQARQSIRRLSALCVLLFLSLVGTVGTVQSQPMNTAGMYGAVLLHEGVGGYVLMAVAAFTLAVVITVVCMRLHERERQKQKRERQDKEDAI